jgi:hypothetical protein
MTKQQHFISESLLKFFSEDQNKLFEFLVKTKTIFPTTVKKTMKLSYAYEHKDLPVNTVEKYYAKIETQVAPIISSLVDSLDKDDFSWIKFRSSLEGILPTLLKFYYRSGALLKEFSTMQKDAVIPLLSEKILNDKYIERLSDTLKEGYKICILKSDNEFILSDQYISTASLKIKHNFTNISNRNIGLMETIVLIPLSSSYYVAYWNSSQSRFFQENAVNQLDKSKLELINKAIINNSYIKAIAYSKDCLENAKIYYKNLQPTTVLMGYEDGSTVGAVRKKEVFFYEIDEKAFTEFELGTIAKYLNLNRNDPCPCNSGKKYKRCHLKLVERLDTPLTEMKYRGTNVQNFQYIDKKLLVEVPISQWSNYST